MIRKKKNCHIPDEKSHGLGTQRESRKQMTNYLFFSRRFWVKEPFHSENFQANKRYTVIPYRSMRQVHHHPHNRHPICIHKYTHQTPTAAAAAAAAAGAPVAPPLLLLQLFIIAGAERGCLGSVVSKCELRTAYAGGWSKS